MLNGKNAIMIAIRIDGNKLATRTFFPQTRLIPTQQINIEPINEMLNKANSVINGFTNDANKVIDP